MMKKLLLCLVIIIVILDTVKTQMVTRQDCVQRNPNKLLCCDIPIPDDMKEHQRTCNQEVLEKVALSSKFSEQWCVEECVFKKMGYLDEENKINQTSFFDSMNEVFNETQDYWTPIFKISFDYCSTEAQSRERDINSMTAKAPFYLERSNCSGIPSFILKCMEVYMTKACPEKHWFESLDCENYKHYLERCPNQFPPPEYL